MTAGKRETRPTAGTVRRAVESGNICKMSHTSTTNDTTIGGCGQMELLANGLPVRRLIEWAVVLICMAGAFLLGKGHSTRNRGRKG